MGCARLIFDLRKQSDVVCVCIMKGGTYLPEVIRINLTGKLQPGVYAKDVILYVIGKLKADYGVYKAVEFAGPAIKQFSLSERMAMCNMSTEMGAKTRGE